MQSFRAKLATLGIAIVICSGQGFAQSQANPTTFQDKLVEMNYAEINLAHLAMMNSRNPEVRDFAEKLARDHTQALDRIQGTDQTSALSDSDTDKTEPPSDQTQIAGREKPSMSESVDRSKLTREHQLAADRLSHLSGSQFDQDFISAMIREHRNAVRMLEQEAGVSSNRTRPGTSSSTTSDDTASLAQEMLPQVRMHLSEAQQIQKDLQSGQSR